MTVTHHFKFPNGPHEEALRKAFPVPANLSPYEVERRIRFQVWHSVLWTGVNQLDALYNGKPFSSVFAAQSMAWSILEWIEQNQAFNSGLGPTVDCAVISNLYVGILAAYGIPARRIAVLFEHDGPDHIAEACIEGHWFMVVPQLNAVFPSGRSKGGLMSYRQAWEDSIYANFESETGDWPMHRVMDKARELYRTFQCTKAAYALNGNACNVNGAQPVYLSLTPNEVDGGAWMAAPSVQKIAGLTKAQLYPVIGKLSEDMEITV